MTNIYSKAGAQALKEQVAYESRASLADEFIAMLEKWHSYPEVYDAQLDAQIHRQQAEILAKRVYFDFKSQPYFSPSSANSDPRELYVKMRGAKKDIQARAPHQTRWQKLGTAIGDLIQRELLFIEKHYERITGEKPPFVPLRTKEGYPAWEDYVKKLHVVEHNGERFALFGKPDGVLIHVATGTRVGLEIKSKQTTAAQTGDYSMKGPKDDHVKQVTTYSPMYDVDDFIILYVNASKKSWVMTEDEYAKSPDLRAFYNYVSEGDRQALLDGFADVVKAHRGNVAPPLNLDKFTFNNFKTACALDLSDEEVAALRTQVESVRRSRLPEWRKRGYVEALEFIEKVRKEAV